MHTSMHWAAHYGDQLCITLNNMRQPKTKMAPARRWVDTPDIGPARGFHYLIALLEARLLIRLGFTHWVLCVVTMQQLNLINRLRACCICRDSSRCDNSLSV